MQKPCVIDELCYTTFINNTKEREVTEAQTVFYEWDVEEVTDVETDEHEENEVIDHHFKESYAECKQHAATKAPTGMRFDIVLVCNTTDNRSWAYMKDDGTLPEFFEDTYQHRTRKVPKRFHKEIRKA